MAGASQLRDGREPQPIRKGTFSRRCEVGVGLESGGFILNTKHFFILV